MREVVQLQATVVVLGFGGGRREKGKEESVRKGKVRVRQNEGRGTKLEGNSHIVKLASHLSSTTALSSKLLSTTAGLFSRGPGINPYELLRGAL